MRSDPIQQIMDDRAQARRLGDTGADICFLALADQAGHASARTLVLRDIKDNRFLLFVNRSSPKWQALESGASWELLLWYHSMQRQYRIGGSTQECDTQFVRDSWQRRPRGSKYLDILYESTQSQSSTIESRSALIDRIQQIREQENIDEMEAPSKVTGIELVADRIEVLDLNHQDRIHDRQRFTLQGSDWIAEFLVP